MFSFDYEDNIKYRNDLLNRFLLNEINISIEGILYILEQFNSNEKDLCLDYLQKLNIKYETIFEYESQYKIVERLYYLKDNYSLLEQYIILSYRLNGEKPVFNFDHFNFDSLDKYLIYNKKHYKILDKIISDLIKSLKNKQNFDGCNNAFNKLIAYYDDESKILTYLLKVADLFKNNGYFSYASELYKTSLIYDVNIDTLWNILLCNLKCIDNNELVNSTNKMSDDELYDLIMQACYIENKDFYNSTLELYNQQLETIRNKEEENKDLKQKKYYIFFYICTFLFIGLLYVPFIATRIITSIIIISMTIYRFIYLSKPQAIDKWKSRPFLLFNMDLGDLVQVIGIACCIVFPGSCIGCTVSDGDLFWIFFAACGALAIIIPFFCSKIHIIFVRIILPILICIFSIFAIFADFF